MRAARLGARGGYGVVAPEDAEVIVALPRRRRADACKTPARAFMTTGKPILRHEPRHWVGFLMNEFREDALTERLAAATTHA